MKFLNKEITNKQANILFSSLIFIFMTFLASHVIMYDLKLYDDKCYADMITVSESLADQVYGSIMKSFSRVTTVAELTANRGLALANNDSILRGIMANTRITGFLFMPKGKVEAVYPPGPMNCYLGLDISKDFPEVIPVEEISIGSEPVIVGPFTIPQSENKAMAVLCPYYTFGPNGREYAGHTAVVVDFPEIFGDVDFSVANERNISCRIWRYDEHTSKMYTLMESKESLPMKMEKNMATFHKTYFTSTINYTLCPNYKYYNSKGFYLLLLAMIVLVAIVTIATSMIVKGIASSQELELYKIQNDLVKVQEHTIISLSNLVENRDSDTGEHVRRTSDYVYMIATEAQKKGLYSDILTDEYIAMIKYAAPMHDIGKIVVPDAVLKKPGKLTPEEFDQIKLHTLEGAKIINDIIGPVQTKEFVKITQDIAEGHHEKWNGRGYPHGLEGEAIPLSARIMALADVFDALTTPRCYKDPFPFEKAVEIIQNDRGIAFDPALTDVFLENQDKLKEILNKYFGTGESDNK